MRIVAGIDEAGYAPRLGPLVVGCAVFSAPDGTDDLWEGLAGAVRRAPGRSGPRRTDGRLLVDDSKRLYGRGGRLGRLERSVVAFASHGAGRDFEAEDDALDALTGGADPRADGRLVWYAGHLAASHPAEADAGDIRAGRDLLAEAGGGAAGLSSLSARAVSAAELNARLTDERNKADCLWEAVSDHLLRIWKRWSAERPVVVVDRLGGRGYYSEKLSSSFGDAMIWVTDEGPAESRYFIESRQGAMTVSFRVKADASHMPAALAGMTAKYVRELFMGRLNRFFAGHVPELRPSAGYPGDAGRFLDETAGARASLGVADELLVRSR